MRALPPIATPVQARRGMILLIVITLLTLFAVTGLSFVFYAEAEVKSSQNFKENAGKYPPDVDPEAALSLFLGKLIYGERDDVTGIYSALRGHDLGRNMYGFNYKSGAITGAGGAPILITSPGHGLTAGTQVTVAGVLGNTNANGTWTITVPNPNSFRLLGSTSNGAAVPGSGYWMALTVPGNPTAFNGTGRLHYQYDPTTAPPSAPILLGQDDYTLINYQYFSTDGFLRDPERLFARVGPNAAPGPYTGGFNAAYTYPDLNSMFLGAVQANGNLLTPSFHREYLFGRLDQLPTTDAAATANNNQKWVKLIGKYQTLRPRPIDQLNQGQVASVGLALPIVWDTMPQPQQQQVLTLISTLQSQGQLFPYPEGRFGDVQNLPGGNGPDSFWMDPGSPVMVAPDGRKYKMMVAALISDLDGRVNLNVAGLVPGSGNPARGSNQGWGRWEVNLTPIFGTNTASNPLFQGRNNPTVLGRYAGGGGVPANNTNLPVAPRGPWYAPVDWDANGTAPNPLMPPNPGTNNVWAFPTPAGSAGGYTNYGNALGAETTNHPSKYNPFQIAPDRAFRLSNLEALLRYGDKGSPALTSDLFTAMPTNFNSTTATGAFIRNLVTLRSGDVASAGSTPYVQDRLTGASQYGNTAAANTAGPPTGAAIGFPAVKPRFNPSVTAGSLLPRSEFGQDWRGQPSWTAPLASLVSRLDLNRLYQAMATAANPGTNYFTDYPAPNAATGQIANTAAGSQFDIAQKSRQQLAKDIYNLLIRVTGARDPNDPTDVAAANPNVPAFKAAQWLAQLAVNIVDYMDDDDYSTPFVWWPLNGNPNDPNNYNSTNIANRVVFGTELPRLVLNEAYVQLDNDPADPGIAGVAVAAKKATYYKMDVWVELHNTFKTTPATDTYPRDGGQAFLQRSFGTVYQVLVARPPGTPGGLTAAQVANPPQPAAPGGPVLGKVTSWGTGVANDPLAVVKPANGAYSFRTGANGINPPALPRNTGFYVLGPLTTYLASAAANNRGANPNLPTTFLSPGMSVKLNTGDLTPTTIFRPIILLRRLACPHLPPNDPNEPGFNAAKAINPYITVDTMNMAIVPTNTQASTTNSAIQFNTTGQVQASLITSRSAYGRLQPYRAAAVGQQLTSPSNNAAQPQPKNTFYRHNGANATTPTNGPTLKVPFDWLTHLDRPLTSPLELLHVSAYPPQSLTQQFMTGAAQVPTAQWQHYAPWFHDNTRIYRFFEFVRTHELAAGAQLTSRLPGAININTMWDQEVLLAAAGNDAQANGAFTLLTASRTPNSQIAATDANVYPPNAATNYPFRSLATGFMTGNASPTAAGWATPSGLSNTILRPRVLGSVTAPPFQVGGNSALRLFDTSTTDHPYKRFRVLTKLFNNITTRSNVFAVWLTVGFFEVTDDSTQPVKLGAEVGRADNRHIRHRMFAIVDRSDLRVFTGLLKNAATAGGTSTVTIMDMNGLVPVKTVTGGQMILNKGDVLVLEPDTPREETVVVSAVGPAANQYQFTATQAHAANTVIIMRGNPGPSPNPVATTAEPYNIRRDTGIVPYFSIID